MAQPIQHDRRRPQRDCPDRHTPAAHRPARWIPLAVCFVLLGLWACRPAQAEEKSAGWWEAETALGAGGTLILSDKPWWKRARALAPGEHFTADSKHPGGGRMLISRQRLKQRRGNPLDSVVWVIDDDGDLRPDATGGDKDSDCYVVDYDADGRVDRMVDYLDNNRDGKPDEMDLRYFWDGQLRIAWFGLDLDGDGRMWDVQNYEYSHNFFRSDPYGNNMIFANKYDPQRGQWVPISECPFAFFDTDGDGESERTIRVSAVPLLFDPQKEPDYGNSGWSYRAAFQPRMRRMGAVNVRYGIDVDGLSSAERPLHYDMGFNLIGRVPYQFDGMARSNPLRRPPKTTVVIPHESLIRMAETYPAEQTGFSWREYGDDTVALGHEPHAQEDRRWEGVFWTWSRRIMHNTGGPIQNWNTRREFRPTPSKKRELYYCQADRRIHLKGATEGWILVGHLAGDEPWGEIRFFDTDADGYFDRWETHLAGVATPARVSTAVDPGIRDLPHDWQKIQEIYTKELLPEALQANRKLTAAMRSLEDFEPPEHLVKALEAASCPSERLYVRDILREMQYLALRDKLARRSGELLAAFPDEDLRLTPERMAGSTRAWNYARTVSRLDAAYGEGRYEEAVRLLHALAKLDPKEPAVK